MGQEIEKLERSESKDLGLRFIKNKKQVGADRIVNTIAVKSLYRTPALVIDFGTTTTFDVINNSGNLENLIGKIIWRKFKLVN